MTAKAIEQVAGLGVEMAPLDDLLRRSVSCDLALSPGWRNARFDQRGPC